MQVHGAENTGRSLSLLWWQVVNYLQYFDWQWANGLAPLRPVFALVRLPFTLLFIALGVSGASFLRRIDRPVFWLLLVLFLTTGPMLVGYMNFKPGSSLLWNVYPDPGMHEVRERDYFYAVSFAAWGLFAGLGVVVLYVRLRETALVFVLAAVPLLLNFRAASRRLGPDVSLPRDFAYDMLQSVEPYAILFTNGDNDTFPLWYLQEVEGIRQDVVVVNLSLANTDWYIRQIRDRPVRRYVVEQASAAPSLVLKMSEREIANFRAHYLPQVYLFRVGRITHIYNEGRPLYPSDLLVLRLIEGNYRSRPIYFSTANGPDTRLRLDDYLTQEGLVFHLYPQFPPDSTRLRPGAFDPLVDVPRTDQLVRSVYRYAKLLEADSLQLEPAAAGIAADLSMPFLSLGRAYAVEGSRRRAVQNLRMAYKLSPNPRLEAVIDSLSAAK
jgi:hypothetical protein